MRGWVFQEDAAAIKTYRMVRPAGGLTPGFKTAAREVSRQQGHAPLTTQHTAGENGAVDSAPSRTQNIRTFSRERLSVCPSRSGRAIPLDVLAASVSSSPRVSDTNTTRASIAIKEQILEYLLESSLGFDLEDSQHDLEDRLDATRAILEGPEARLDRQETAEHRQKDGSITTTSTIHTPPSRRILDSRIELDSRTGLGWGVVG